MQLDEWRGAGIAKKKLNFPETELNLRMKRSGDWRLSSPLEMVLSGDKRDYTLKPSRVSGSVRTRFPVA